MGEKETMSGNALRESRIRTNDGPNRISMGRESSAPGVSEGVTAGDDWPPGGPASASVLGGTVPGGAIISAAVSSVGQLGGQKPGGGAASAAYAREAADGPQLATGDSDGDAPESDAGPRQSSGRMENIGASGMDTGQVESAAPNLGSSGQERSGMPGDPVPDIDAAAAKLNWNIGKNERV